MLSLNHAYRLIWSDHANAYVPVGENAVARGLGPGGIRSRRVAGAGALAAAMVVGGTWVHIRSGAAEPDAVTFTTLENLAHVQDPSSVAGAIPAASLGATGPSMSLRQGAERLSVRTSSLRGSSLQAVTPQAAGLALQVRVLTATLANLAAPPALSAAAEATPPAADVASAVREAIRDTAGAGLSAGESLVSAPTSASRQVVLQSALAGLDRKRAVPVAEIPVVVQVAVDELHSARGAAIAEAFPAAVAAGLVQPVHGQVFLAEGSPVSQTQNPVLLPQDQLASGQDEAGAGLGMGGANVALALFDSDLERAVAPAAAIGAGDLVEALALPVFSIAPGVEMQGEGQFAVTTRMVDAGQGQLVRQVGQVARTANETVNLPSLAQRVDRLARGSMQTDFGAVPVRADLLADGTLVFVVPAQVAEMSAESLTTQALELGQRELGLSAQAVRGVVLLFYLPG